MTSFLAPLALVAVLAVSHGAAADTPAPHARTLSFARDILDDLATALATPQHERLDDGAWMSALACTADLASAQPGLVDETACATTTDDNGGACVWCDATALLGTGMCVGADVQGMAGQFWGQVCVAPAPRPAAAAPAVTLAATRDVLDDLYATALHALHTVEELVGEGDWMSALACTADLTSDQPALIDEAACATTKTDGGGGCVWCDASAVLGTGVCVSTDVQSMAGQFWGQVCGADAPAVTPDPPAAIPDATPDTPPVPDARPAPAPDNGGVPDALKCTVDAAMAPVADAATCAGMTDATGTSCAWCGVSFLGTGACLTSDQMKVTAKFICSAAVEEGTALKKEGSYLRGANEGVAMEDHF